MKHLSRLLYVCLASGTLFLGCGTAYSQVTGLAFRPVDAAYSSALDKVIFISANPNQLHIYDPAVNTDQTAALPLAPQNVSLSPDGLHAAVGFSNAVVYVDLQSASISNTFLNVAVGTGKVICGQGYIYVMPSSYSGSPISIDIAGGQATVANGYFYPSSGAFDSAVNGIYSVGSGPATLVHYDTSSGPVGNATTGGGSSHVICNPLTISHDGSTMYSGCGTIFRASADGTKDMRYLGMLSGFSGVAQSTAISDSRNEFAVIPAIQQYVYTPTPVTDTVVNLYSSVSLTPAGQFSTTPFQKGSASYAAHGRWVFYNSTSSSMFIVSQADPAAGLLQDFQLEEVDLTAANSCNASFGTGAGQSSAPGGYGTVQIVSGEDCAFTAASTAPWIVLASGYYGSGNTTLTYLVRPNLSNTTRSGTIKIGSDTFVVNQDAGGTITALNPLSFKPVAAEYDKASNKIVMVSASPNELHLYDPLTLIDQIVSLPYTPLSLSVRPDGLVAAVGFSGSVATVDLQLRTVVKTIPVDMDNGGILLAGNGYLYAFPSNTWGIASDYSIQISTGALTAITGYFQGNIPHLDKSGNYMYLSGGGPISKLDITNGPATASSSNNSYYSGNIWLSEDGNRLITSGGQVLFTSAVPSQDLQPDGSLSGSTNVDWAADSQTQQQVAILTDQANTSSNTLLQIYTDQGLLLKSETALPGFTNNGTAYSSHGKYLFWNSDESELFAITQADSSSGLLSDYAVNKISSPETATACTYSVSPTSLNVPSGYSNWSVTVTSNCSWKPVSGAAWLDAYGNYTPTIGNGQLSFSTGSNPGGLRTGTISVGNETITVTQAPASCTYSVSTTSASFSQFGGEGSVTLSTGAGCPWSIQNNNSWVAIRGTVSGAGPAYIQFSVPSNSGSPSYRSASFNIAGIFVSVSQITQTSVPSFAVWRPANGTWYVADPDPVNSVPQLKASLNWGVSTDIPVPGDYDGDGKTDFAVWRPANGTWYIVPSGSPSTPITMAWGISTDIPIPGDYDGDGKTDIAVWRPVNGTWYIVPSRTPTKIISQSWGAKEDVPLVGDFNGDGKIDFAVWRKWSGTWYVLYNTYYDGINYPSSYPHPDLQQQWGAASDQPLVGDFNGDRRADFAVWRPSNGTWYVLYNGYNGSTTFPTANLQQAWGGAGDVPLVGDFNGDGRTDFTVFRPSAGTWFSLYNGYNGTSFPFSNFEQHWGAWIDTPIVGKF